MGYILKTFDKEKMKRIGKSAFTIFNLVLAFVYLFSLFAANLLKIFNKYSNDLLLFTAVILTIITYPVIVYLWHKRKNEKINKTVI